MNFRWKEGHSPALPYKRGKAGVIPSGRMLSDKDDDLALWFGDARVGMSWEEAESLQATLAALLQDREREHAEGPGRA